MSSPPTSGIADLVLAILDGGPTARKSAIRQLVQLGPAQSVPALRAEIEKPVAWQTYRRVATALLAVGRLHPDLAGSPEDPLAPIVATAEKGKRFAPLAASLLGWSGDHRVVPQLTCWALAVGADRSCASLRALQRLAAYEAVGTLLRACGDKRYSVKATARTVLFAMGRTEEWGARILVGQLPLPDTVRMVASMLAVMKPRADVLRWLQGEARRRGSSVQAEAAAAAQHLERERMLLQPASAPTSIDPGQLLRPAAGGPAVSPDQLLRAVDEMIDGTEGDGVIASNADEPTIWDRLRRMLGGR